MHPFLADVRKLLAYVLAWMTGALAIAGLLRLTGQARLSDALWFALPLCLVYAFVALSSYYVCRSRPIAQRRWPAVAALFGGASLMSGLGWLGAGMAWNTLGGLALRGAPLVAMSTAGWILFFAAGVLLYLLALLAHDVLGAFESVQAAARREGESRLLAREAELQVLRTQIEPHFLFNSLNSISALTSIDAGQAREMTVDLAQFFRRTLALAGRTRVTLDEEVELCHRFLAIEQRRFGARLRAELRIAPDAGACLLPPMTLQPLLENAIKHGIRQLAEGGTITVDATAADGWLRLAVVNPVGEEAARARDSGLGLVNLRERFTALYGTRARIDCRRTDTHFEIDLALPAEKEPAP